MKEIKEIAEFINDEVDGVLSYAKAAVFYKDSRPDLANTYYTLATVEYQHVQKLHTDAAKLIKEAEGKSAQPTQKMLDTWESQHKRSIKKMEEAKTYLSMYK